MSIEASDTVLKFEEFDDLLNNLPDFPSNFQDPNFQDPNGYHQAQPCQCGCKDLSDTLKDEVNNLKDEVNNLKRQ